MAKVELVALKRLAKADTIGTIAEGEKFSENESYAKYLIDTGRAEKYKESPKVEKKPKPKKKANANKGKAD